LTLSLSLSALLLGAAGCAHDAPTEAEPVSKSAPDFALSDVDGQQVSLAAQRGKVVVLNFWASWCRPCLDELPLLDELHAKVAPIGGTVLGVNIDKQRAPALGVVTSLDLKLPVVFDPGSDVVAKYDPEALPTTYVIDPDGVIVETLSGKLTRDAVSALETRVRKLLPTAR
jgi:peroxiredoxin